MTRHLPRFGLGLALVLVLLAQSAAQPDKEKDGEDYRRFFKTPTTPLEYWNALQFEIDVGRFDLAARHLRELLKKGPTEKDLIAIAEKDGVTPVLRLKNVREWTRDKKANAQAVKDAEDLARRVSAAVRKRLADPKRLRELVGNLGATPEEQAFALREIYASGATAVPYLVEALREAKAPGKRLPLLRALRKLGPETVPPLLAALDSNDTQLQLDILDTLRARHGRLAEQIVPHLWYLTAAPEVHADVRRKATGLLADLLSTAPARLEPAKVALTREAERYYQHRVRFPDPGAVTVWRWDGGNVVLGWPELPALNASQAEEYWGLRYARRALALGPAYRPAQLVLLSLAIEKAMETGGLDRPLTNTERGQAVHDLLARANPELVIAMLERALRDNRTAVVLATVRNLGGRAEVLAARPSGGAQPPLVRALYYPDPRVQFAAAEALLRVPGAPPALTTTRIVEVLARALVPARAADAGRRKVLVAVGEERWRDRVRQAVEKAGGAPVTAANGREAMRKLRAEGDIDAVLLESTLPLPGLAQLLAQMRADVDVARVPVLLAAVPESREARDLLVRYRAGQERLDGLAEAVRPYREQVRALNEKKAAAIRALVKEGKERGFLRSDTSEAVAAVEKDFAKERKDLDARMLGMARLDREAAQIERQMRLLSESYGVEVERREEALRRFVEPYRNITVVPPGALTDAKELKDRLIVQVREAGVALPAAEQQAYAEKAIERLAQLGRGTPKGYDIRPVADTILDALHFGKFSEKGQLAAIRAAGALPGPRPQAELAAVVLDGGRPAPVREAAAAELARVIQKNGVALTPAQVGALRGLAAQPGTGAELKARLGLLLGGLRPGDRPTGERLRELEFRPPPKVLPPPKE
jgi:hypothetical protein